MACGAEFLLGAQLLSDVEDAISCKRLSRKYRNNGAPQAKAMPMQLSRTQPIPFIFKRLLSLTIQMMIAVAPTARSRERDREAGLALARAMNWPISKLGPYLRIKSMLAVHGRRAPAIVNVRKIACSALCGAMVFLVFDSGSSRLAHLFWYSSAGWKFLAGGSFIVWFAVARIG